GKQLISATWNWLWDKHDQLKDVFNFFGRPQKTNKTLNNSTQRTTATNDNGNGNGNNNRSYQPAQLIGLIAGPALFIITLLYFSREGLTSEGRAILASTIWIAIWWMTEAIPIPATSLLPIILFPLTGGLDIGATTSS